MSEGLNARPRSGSNSRPRSGSVMDRLSARPPSPGASLRPSGSRRSSISVKKKKGRKSRTKSVSSGVSNATSSIAHALAKSGLHIASPTDPELPSTQSVNSRTARSNRSPWLVRGDDAFVDDDDDYDIDDEEDETDSEEEHLPVTGFAVASNRRQAEFHAMFPAVDEGDYLIEGGCCCDRADRLRLRPVKGHFGSRPALRVGKPSVFPCQHLRLGY